MKYKSISSHLKDIFISSSILFLLLLSICKYYTSNIKLVCLEMIYLGSLIHLYLTKENIILVVIGCVIGSIGEIICIHYGFWQYANPSFLGIPVWIPPVWGILSICFYRLSISLYTLIQTFLKDHYSFLFNIIRVLMIIYATYTFIRINKGVAIVLGVFFLILVLFANKEYNVILFLVSAIGGTLGEYVCMQYNVWKYTHPILSSIGMPLSLPLAWGLSINMIYLITKAIVNKIVRKN